MKRSSLLIVAVLGMLPLSLAIMAAPPAVVAYAEENEDEGEEGQSETNSEREEEEECVISGVFNTCVVGDASTGVIQTAEDQNEVPMILALPT